MNAATKEEEKKSRKIETEKLHEACPNKCLTGFKKISGEILYPRGRMST